MQYDIFSTSHVDPEIMQECKMDMTYVMPHKALQGVPPRAGGILQRKRTLLLHIRIVSGKTKLLKSFQSWCHGHRQLQVTPQTYIRHLLYFIWWLD